MTTTALGYAELARRLGVKTPTARRMANRHRWRKTRDNHGRALVHVPDEYLAQRDNALETVSKTDLETAPLPALETSGGTDPMTVHLATLMTRLGELERELMDTVHKLGVAETEAASMRATVEELRADRDRWVEQARQLAERRPGLIERIAAVLRRAG